MANQIKPADGMKPNHALKLEQSSTETGAQALARTLLEPQIRHAASASAYASKALGSTIETPGLMDFVDHMQAATGKAETGDLTIASRMLAAQAITLDSMFSELTRRAASNLGEHFNAAEKYARLALKAQSNCRSTLEALARLHQPREQTVRHVHVNEGGQAVIAEQFHHHAGGRQNDQSAKQSEATRAAGAGAALSGPDASRDAMPIARGEGEAPLQDARRDESRRT